MIRRATIDDIDQMLKCINDAKAFLKNSGSTQWNGPLGYPNKNTLLADIKDNISFVCERDGIVCGVAAFQGYEEEYNNPNAKWQIDTLKYTTIHRIAVADEYRGKGVAKELLIYAEEYAKMLGNLAVRIDTHPKNKIVQSLVTSLGYNYCGDIIYSRIPIEPLRLVYEKLI